MNKCPHCQEVILSLVGTAKTVSNVPVLILTCPLCQTIVGVVSNTR